MYGYAGKLLRVNLTSQKLSAVSLEEQTAKDYIGGTCLGVKMLYEEVPPQADWSDPVNLICIASGPLGATRIPGSGTVSIVTKGALTNGATAVQSNGFFGAFLRLSGYDGIVVQGASKRWVYLYIGRDKLEFKDAAHLLGMDTYETADMIKSETGEKDLTMSVLSIGPAGENLVRFAGIFIDKGHAAAHNGTGAVMGSKRLKAIAVARGTKQIEVKDPEKLAVVANKMFERGKRFRGTLDGVYGGGRENLLKRATLPIRNYQTNIWDISDEQLSKYHEPYIRQAFKGQPHSCFACPATHCQSMIITEGPYAGMEIEEPEYEQLAAWGPLIDNKDMASAAMLSSLCDRLGFDNNEAGWLFAWLMECYEKGYVTKEMLGGLEMRWGNVEAVRQVMYMIAHRVGFGNILAEGVMRAAQKLGIEAAKS
ncbi:MAG: aldehyde ferredoxin oxidoreductase N-terminal domain-containing protein, partial [Candidatus Bathyarchaeia archaeon]